MLDKMLTDLLTKNYNDNIEHKFYIERSAKTCAVVDTDVGISETTTTLADMDLTAMVSSVVNYNTA